MSGDSKERAEALAGGDALWSDGLKEVAERGLRRELPSSSFHSDRSNASGPLVLCSNDYLALACDSRLKDAAARALEEDGCGSTGSRLLSGNSWFHVELERELAGFTGFEACLLLSSGYHVNVGVIPAVAARVDAIFSDELNHASIIDGCRLSRAKTTTYHHCDLAHLGSLLKKASGKGRKLIITEGVFSMDGDLAPVADLVQLAKAHGALLMLDDAHAFGVLGSSGRGTPQQAGVEEGIDIYVGTLGKAIGAMGGFVGGSRALIDYLTSTARALLYSTALPPSICAAATEALRIVRSEKWRAERLRASSQTLRSRLGAAGLNTGRSESHIIPVITGTGDRAINLAEGLRQRGYLTRAIRYPTVPEGGERIRLSLRSDFGDEVLGRFAQVLREEAERLGIVSAASG
jgi:8-amino-7-oxononanoate synthase